VASRSNAGIETLEYLENYSKELFSACQGIISPSHAVLEISFATVEKPGL
jgi:hypothetical protein